MRKWSGTLTRTGRISPPLDVVPGPRILIASANPWSFALAAERHFAAHSGDATVDMINLYRLVECKFRRPRDRMIETLERKIERFVVRAINGRDVTADLHIPADRAPPVADKVSELRRARRNGAAIGLGALSSGAEVTTIHATDSTAEFGEPLQRAWRVSNRSYAVAKAVESLGYDQVILFGGRHCSTRAFCDVLRHSARVTTYEQGGGGNRFIHTDGSLYDPKNYVRLIEQFTNFRSELGEAFFDRRLAKAKGTDSAFFTAAQVQGRVPSGLSERSYVTFFTSSPDERFGVDEDFRFGSFESQFQAALAIAEACGQNGKALIVRLHPHLAYKHPSWKREWDFNRLRAAGVLVIMPEEPFDSYSLARSAHAVFTAGSTIGMEATYLGTPSACVGSAISSELRACARVDTAGDIHAFVASPTIPPDALQRVLLFGCYQLSGGIELPELDVGTHPTEARIAGRLVDPVRCAVHKVRKGAALVTGNEVPNRSGIVAGKVVLPSGKRYAKRPARNTTG